MSQMLGEERDTGTSLAFSLGCRERNEFEDPEDPQASFRGQSLPKRYIWVAKTLHWCVRSKVFKKKSDDFITQRKITHESNYLTQIPSL